MLKKKGIDIIDKILEACYKQNPDALFVMSLMHQYEERGSLSKKQLEGLYQKASRVKDLPQNLLATLEAQILKMPTRSKSNITENKSTIIKDEETEKMINEIMEKFPAHKRVLFLQSKFKKSQSLLPDETKEVKRFYTLLIQKK